MVRVRRLRGTAPSLRPALWHHRDGQHPRRRSRLWASDHACVGGPLPRPPDRGTPGVEAEALRGRFPDDPARHLSLPRRAGPEQTSWTWGRVGRPVRFPHPLGELPSAGTRFSIEPLPKATEGSSETVNAGMFVSMRLIADLSDWDQSRQGIALGESGDPASPHWKDQLADWRSVSPRSFPFSPAAVCRAALGTDVLLSA